MLYSPEGSTAFWRNISLPSSDQKSKPAEVGSKLNSVYFLLGILFDPEGGDNVSLQNIVLPPNYIALPQLDIPSIHKALPLLDVREWKNMQKCSHWPGSFESSIWGTEVHIH